MLLTVNNVIFENKKISGKEVFVMAADILITLSAAAHVFTAIVTMILAVLMFSESLWGGSSERLKLYGLGLIVFSVLTYLLAGWWYVVYYGADKAIIKAGEMAWAHTIIMETKEHAFISGFWLSIVLGLFGYFSTEEQLKDPNFRKTVALLSVTLILGTIVLDAMGGIIVAGLKVGLGGG